MGSMGGAIGSWSGEAGEEMGRRNGVPQTPALAITMSSVLVGEKARAALKAEVCEGKDVVSVA